MDIARAYDAIPYPDEPIPDLHPAFLGGVATLFGLTPPPPGRARILELGCANGGNLIALARALPEATLLGIELSPHQTAAAQQAIQQTQRTNVSVRQGDILHLDVTLGTWDYILVHGVYSWVPEPVRQHLLRLIGTILSPHGLASISYNTLPGWRGKGALREMLLHHVRGEDEPLRQIQSARELLAMLETAWDENDALSVRYLRHEAQRLQQQPDGYLFHEYLSPINSPLWFQDFVAQARDGGLEYVGDADLARMEPLGMGKRTEATLSAITDPMERWQRLDMVLNRNFRQSLLCRADSALPVQREIQWDRLDVLALEANAQPMGGLDLRKARPGQVRTRQGERLTVSHPVVKGALILLGQRHPESIPLMALLSQAHRMAAQAGCSPALLADPGPVFGELGGLLVRGAVRPILPDA